MRLCVGTSKGIVLVDSKGHATPVSDGPTTVWSMAQDSKDPNLIYAGKANHSTLNFDGRAVLSRSTDGGKTWTDISKPEFAKEEVWALTAAPDESGAIYIGTSHGRLFKSTDKGETIRECTAFLKVPGRDHWSFPPPPHVAHIRSICFDPKDSSTFYLGVEEGGVFRSRDRGETFESISEGIYDDVHEVRVDPHDSDLLYATTGRGFYRSEDAGASWEYITNGIAKSYTVPLLVKNGGATVIYTVAASDAPPFWYNRPTGAEALLYRSTDLGKSFEIIPCEGLAHGAMAMRLLEEPSGGMLSPLNDGTVIRADNHGMQVIAEKLPRTYALVTLE